MSNPPRRRGEAPPALSSLTRRRLLRAAGAGGLFLLGASWVYRTVRSFEPPGEGRLCLSQGEVSIAERIAEAFFPGPPHVPLSAAEANLGRFADEYIASLYLTEARLFRLLLRTLNLAPVLSRGRSFYWLPLAARQEVLEDWSKSSVQARRAGYQSLRFMFSLGYFEDPGVRRAMGFEFGCALPDPTERR